MSRRLKKLIKVFRFEETNRALVTLGADTRLNPGTSRIQLKKIGATEAYSTAVDLQVRTRLTNPNTVKAWIGFEALARNKANPATGAQVTDVKFRLSVDGVNDLYWDGAAWSAAGASDWNTEAEVAANIAAFPVATQSLQVAVNLSTSDARYTPEVDWVKVLYESDLEWQEDYIARSLIPELREQIRPIAEFALDLLAASATVDLTAVETPYNIVAVDSAYNLTSDPRKLTDLAQSYDTGTKVLTLSGSQPLGERILIRFIYEPEVALLTSQDYSELAKVPVVVIEDVELFNRRGIEPGDHVINRATGDGWQLTHGYHADIDLEIRWIVDQSKDQQRLADEFKRFFATNQQLRSRGQDEPYDLWLVDQYGQQATASQDELQAGRLRARIVRAVFYARDAKPVPGVRRFVVTGGNMEFETP